MDNNKNEGLLRLREQIDKIDDRLLEAFLERVEVVKGVAEYKKVNNLPVLQQNREDEVIKAILNKAPKEVANGCEILFKNIMDISKSMQSGEIFAKENKIDCEEYSYIKGDKIACQGSTFAYSHLAATKLFGEDSDITFYPTFDEVFDAVENGEMKYAVLPVQNSTAGSIEAVYDLLAKRNCFIAYEIKIRIEHCLAVKNGTDIKNVKEVYSHQQALSQCSNFINESGLKPVPYLNTALAAEKIASSNEEIAAISSKFCAENLKLNIIKENIENSSENYTRFICISKKAVVSEKANIISLTLSLPHTSGALYRLLTKFSVAGLNLLRIESKPIASKEFNVLFFLDFTGNIQDEKVASFINSLKFELSDFKFLGNYAELA